LHKDAVNRGREPPSQAWVNSGSSADAPGMTHLLNLLCGSVLVYASVTRGGLAVARGLELALRRAG